MDNSDIQNQVSLNFFLDSVSCFKMNYSYLKNIWVSSDIGKLFPLHKYRKFPRVLTKLSSSIHVKQVYSEGRLIGRQIVEGTTATEFLFVFHDNETVPEK